MPALSAPALMRLAGKSAVITGASTGIGRAAALRFAGEGARLIVADLRDEQGESLCHEHHFAACAASERGFDTMLIAAKALARTALDLLEEPELLAQAAHEFEVQSQRQSG